MKELDFIFSGIAIDTRTNKVFNYTKLSNYTIMIYELKTLEEYLEEDIIEENISSKDFIDKFIVLFDSLQFN